MLATPILKLPYSDNDGVNQALDKIDKAVFDLQNSLGTVADQLNANGTILDVDGINDGDILARSGTTIIGIPAPSVDTDGTGGAGFVAFWRDANTVGGFTGFSFDDTTIQLLVAETLVGAATGITSRNNDGTNAASHAFLAAISNQGGGTGGDAVLFLSNQNTDWVMHIDTSDSDILKITQVQGAANAEFQLKPGVGLGIGIEPTATLDVNGNILTRGGTLASTGTAFPISVQGLNGVIEFNTPNAPQPIRITDTGSLELRAEGTGLNLTETGAAARMGVATLTNGTVTVSTTSVTAASRIFLTRRVGAGTTRGILTVGTIVAATSFVIRAEDLAGVLSADDDSDVSWVILEPTV